MPDGPPDSAAPAAPDATERQRMIEEVTGHERSRRWSRAAVSGVAAVAVVALTALLGVLVPAHPDGISTDRLGPEHGQPVADHLAEARASLSGSDDADHWALLSPTTELVPTDLPATADGLRIAEVLYRVPVPDVQTPVVAVPVPAGDAVAVRSAADAATLLIDERDRAVALDERARAILTLSAARLGAGCACVVGLVVRGPLSRLRDLAARPGVRAVQALPADAVSGSFAVVPLLPSQHDRALPGPDTGPVPQP